MPGRQTCQVAVLLLPALQGTGGAWAPGMQWLANRQAGHGLQARSGLQTDRQGQKDGTAPVPALHAAATRSHHMPYHLTAAGEAPYYATGVHAHSDGLTLIMHVLAATSAPGLPVPLHSSCN